MEVVIPDDRPFAIPQPNQIVDSLTIYFGKTGKTYVECQSRGQVLLIAALAELKVPKVQLPTGDRPCRNLLQRIKERIQFAKTRFSPLVGSRTGDDRVRTELTEVLLRWFVMGKQT